MTKTLIRPLLKKEINHRLKQRKLENVEVIRIIENFFRKKRNYVFKMPKPNSHVILLFSGGVDSLTAWFYLTKYFKLIVHPLVRIGGDSGTHPTFTPYHIKKISSYFKKRIPRYYKKPFYYRDHFAKESLERELKKTLIQNKEYLLEMISSNKQLNTEIPDFMSQYVSPALQYKKILEIKHQENISTVFTGINALDGVSVKSQTLTSLRSIMFNTCNTTQDYSFQFTSLAIEKELGFFFSADEFLSFISDEDLPLSNSWSCQKPGLIHCGQCQSCYTRKSVFSKIGFEDKTKYLSKIQKWIFSKFTQYRGIRFLTFRFICVYTVIVGLVVSVYKKEKNEKIFRSKGRKSRY